MKSCWEREEGRKLDLKLRAQKRTSTATASPESLAKKSRGSSEAETEAIRSGLGGLTLITLGTADSPALDLPWHHCT